MGTLPVTLIAMVCKSSFRTAVCFDPADHRDAGMRALSGSHYHEVQEFISNRGMILFQPSIGMQVLGCCL